MFTRMISNRINHHYSQTKRFARLAQLHVDSLEPRRLMAVLNVDVSDPSCSSSGPVYCEIADAVDVAAESDTVSVASGTYEPFTISINGITVEEATEDANPIVENGTIQIDADNVMLKGVHVEDAQNLPAFDIFGSNNTLIGNSSSNTGGGFRIFGTGNTLIDNTAADSQSIGFRIETDGTDHVLEGNTADNNNLAGFWIANGSDNTLRENVSRGNRLLGFIVIDDTGLKSGNVLEDNVAESNGAFGFRILSSNNSYHNNRSLDNGAAGLFLEAGQGNLIYGHASYGNGGVGMNDVSPLDNVFQNNSCWDNAAGNDSHGGSLCSDPILGDSNLDGHFDSSDLTRALQGGKYETGEVASFFEGDWNGDGIFDSLDLIVIFQEGSYEQLSPIQFQGFQTFGAPYHFSQAPDAPTAPQVHSESHENFVRLTEGSGDNNAISFDEYQPVTGPAIHGKTLSFDFRLSGDIDDANFKGGFGAGYFGGPWGLQGARNPGLENPDFNWENPTFPVSVALGFNPKENTISLNGFGAVMAEVDAADMPFDLNDGNFHRVHLTVRPNPEDATKALFDLSIDEDVETRNVSHSLLRGVDANINLANLPPNRIMAGARSVNGSLAVDVDNFSVRFLDPN